MTFHICSEIDPFKNKATRCGCFLYLTLCILMDFPIHIDTISMGLPIIYFKGSQVDHRMLYIMM